MVSKYYKYVCMNVYGCTLYRRSTYTFMYVSKVKATWPWEERRFLPVAECRRETKTLVPTARWHWSMDFVARFLSADVATNCRSFCCTSFLISGRMWHQPRWRCAGGCMQCKYAMQKMVGSSCIRTSQPDSNRLIVSTTVTIFTG